MMMSGRFQEEHSVHTPFPFTLFYFDFHISILQLLEKVILAVYIKKKTKPKCFQKLFRETHSLTEEGKICFNPSFPSRNSSHSLLWVLNHQTCSSHESPTPSPHKALLSTSSNSRWWCMNPHPYSLRPQILQNLGTKKVPKQYHFFQWVTEILTERKKGRKKQRKKEKNKWVLNLPSKLLQSLLSENLFVGRKYLKSLTLHFLLDALHYC